MPIPPSFDKLHESYWAEQAARVNNLIGKINSRPQVDSGLEVPDDDDLSIGQGKRIPMAVMFLDISGFSSMHMETVEEQDLILRVLNLFFSEMIKIGEEYGGWVEKNTGDGLLIHFEDSTGTENGGVKRAVSCALTMIAATESLVNPALENVPIPKISFRVSIDCGYVTIAKIGAQKRFNARVAIGATANFASKMLAHAQPGEIVLGENARNKLPEFWKNKFTRETQIETGWVFLSDRRPYRLFFYDGRWIQPAEGER